MDTHKHNPDNSNPSSALISSSAPVETMDSMTTDSIQGSTCTVERFCEGGKTLFRKTLKEELAHQRRYVESLKKEFEVGMTIESDYLPRYVRLEHDADGNPAAIVMENIEGLTLKDVLRNYPDYFNKKENLHKFLTQLCDGLSCLHQRQIVHLDLQPRNIMLTRVGKDVRIIDFGYCYSDNFQTTCGGTSAFSSFDETPDCRSDIFSIGQLIHYINMHSALPLSKGILRVARKAAELMPEQRHANLAELEKDVEKVLGRNKQALALTLLTLILCGGAIALGGHFMVPDREFYAHSDVDSTLFRFQIINSDSNWVAIVRDNEDAIYKESIAIPDTVEHKGKKYAVVEMGDSCFALKNQIKVITMPPTMRKVGVAAAFECASLIILNMPDSITEIGQRAFHGCQSLSELRLPERLREIGPAAFAHARTTTITVPEGVTELKQDVFACCDLLTDVHLPKSLKHLHRGVFWDCGALQRITIPEGVTQMDELIFYACPSLTEVTMLPLTPPKASMLFQYPYQITLHVPAAALEAYRQDAFWGQYRIEPLQD